MDSLTQIVLGAACGEAVLGRKIGNKALLFGAIGGTIPDLDVFVGRLLYSNQIDTMAYHRGFMHSIFFAIIGAFAFGWLVFKLYDKGKRKHTTTLSNWRWLFFWSLFTHPILDSFTGYGTQLFAPFSNYRVAFNNISVVDVFYTLPFLVCMIVLMFFNRNSTRRQYWLKLGIAISSVYMLFTLGNKLYIDHVFKSSLKHKNIKYSRFQTQPSLMANILWYGTVETESDFLLGYYSNFDSEDYVVDWVTIPKTKYSIQINHPDIKTLKWFSKGYFNIYEDEDEDEVEDEIENEELESYIYTDLRYPLWDPNDPTSSVFSFQIYKKGERWDMKRFSPARGKEKMSFKEALNLFKPMFERMGGN